MSDRTNDKTKILEHSKMLFDIAYGKTKDLEDAKDIVQETYLDTIKAIDRGVVIQNMKSFLLKVLKDKFHDFLRKKYRNSKMLFLESHNLDNIFYRNESDNTEIEAKNTELLMALRKELAFLSKIYREVLIMYYIEGKSTSDIAELLNIPKEQVLLRLARGRKKVKEGMQNMKIHDTSIYNPELLNLVVIHFLGVNNEPLSVISDKIDQSILIAAYEKPITLSELSDKMGVPAVFIEEKVDKLVYHELMKKVNTKVFTDFPIIDKKTMQKVHEVQIKYVDEVFDDVKEVFFGLVDEYKKLSIGNSFSDTQMYLLALKVIMLIKKNFLEEVFQFLKVDDYPDRPNGGKWIVRFGYKKTDKEKELIKYLNFFEDMYETNESTELLINVWDSEISKCILRDNDVRFEDITELFCKIHKKLPINNNKIVYIPDLIKLGFINRDEHNNLKLNFPYITWDEYQYFNKINREYFSKYYNIVETRLIKMINDNVLEIPKHISPVSSASHLLVIVGIAITFISKTVESGLINIDYYKNYPLAIMTEKLVKEKK